jgi:hypothetical protein
MLSFSAQLKTVSEGRDTFCANLPVHTSAGAWRLVCLEQQVTGKRLRIDVYSAARALGVSGGSRPFSIAWQVARIW